jgi:hypothetical protein
VGEHCLREDVPEVLARAAGRALSGADTAALLRCFLLDASGTISWLEFERCWRALLQLGSTPGPGAHKVAGKLRRQAGAGAAQHRQQQAVATSQVGLEEAHAAAVSLFCYLCLHRHTLQSEFCPLPPPLQPPTAQQEVGWHHAAAPLMVRERCEAPGARYLPLRGTDVTRGAA